MFSFPEQSMCGLSLAPRTQVTEIFALGREDAECSLQRVKSEILDKQLLRDPISWAMLWSHGNRASENTFVILSRERLEKEHLPGSRRWGYGQDEGGLGKGLGWELVPGKPSALSLTSSSPTFPFYIPTPLSFLLTKLTWQKELRLWKQTNKKWALSGIDTQNVLNEWKGPSFFCRRDILFPLPLRRPPFLCLYYGNYNATSRAI